MVQAVKNIPVLSINESSVAVYIDRPVCPGIIRRVGLARSSDAFTADVRLLTPNSIEIRIDGGKAVVIRQLSNL
jgi:hypothetical protein